jgi:hypothetical protein
MNKSKAWRPDHPSIGSGASPVLLREEKEVITNERANSNRFQLLKFWADTIVARFPASTSSHFFS